MWDIDDLRRRIHDALALVTEKILKNTWGKMKLRLDIIAKQGGKQGELCYFCHHFQNKNMWLNKTLLEIQNKIYYFFLFNHISVY